MSSSTYPFSRYILTGTNSSLFVFDRHNRRQVSGPFDERREAVKEIERLHDIDRASLKNAIERNENGIADRMLADVEKTS